MTGAVFHGGRTAEAETARKCQACKRVRPIVLFAKGGGRRALICQGCFDSTEAARLRQRRIDRYSLRGMKNFPVEVRRRVQQMWASARLNSWRKGYLFDISQQWLAMKVMAGSCEVTGIPFEMFGTLTTARRLFAPSLDRRDPAEGYTTANCQIVVWIYNCAKADGTHEDVMRLARALVAMERHVAASAASEPNKEAA